MVPRKASKLQPYETVPQTDTGGRDEYSKGLRRVNLFTKRSEVVPRKASKLQSYETVPQTDTGGRDEYSKALERTREKELGKLVP